MRQIYLHYYKIKIDLITNIKLIGLYPIKKKEIQKATSTLFIVNNSDDGSFTVIK